MKATTYLKKYHDNGAKMFCAACRWWTGSPVWLVARYYAHKAAGNDTTTALQEIQADDIATAIFNEIEGVTP